MLLVHGFTQNAECMAPFARELGTAMEAASQLPPPIDDSDGDPGTPSLALCDLAPSIYGIDLPGHGRSSSIQTGPWETARLLGEAFGRGIYVGYSMGARICLHLALSSPELVEALILISASAGIDDGEARMARKISDDAMAVALEGGTPDIAGFLERWTGQPLFSTLPEQAKMIEERLANTPSGLASSLRLCGAGVCDSLWGRLHELEMPVHCVAGMLDGRYSYYALRTAQLIGANATVSLIPSAGHACYAERPKLISSLVASLLGRGISIWQQ
jgi:2-succinyl-6-hydroxy-2,4-cyclohexadiene-1-carboxylate synthase